MRPRRTRLNRLLRASSAGPAGGASGAAPWSASAGPTSAGAAGGSPGGPEEAPSGSRLTTPVHPWRAWVSSGSLEDRAAVVLGVVVLGLFALVNEKVPIETSHSFDLAAGGMLVLATALLLASRRFPATVALLVFGISVTWYSRYTNRLIDLPTLVAFFALGATGDRRRQLGVAGVAVTVLVVGVATSPSDAEVGVEIVVEGVGWMAAAILCGELVRSRRLLLGNYAERAARAEAERDAEAERRVANERLRIARDLHDVLAHTVSLMTVQAGVAADAVDRDPAAARTALATLRSVGKEAMAEVRATVAVLRGADAGAAAETAPAPGVERVPELVDAARAQGLDVDLALEVEGVEVDGLVALTAYRIVQESLTNAIRHADASHAVVRLRPHAAALVVEVVDNGRATSHVPLPQFTSLQGDDGSFPTAAPGGGSPPPAATADSAPPPSPAPSIPPGSAEPSGSQEPQRPPTAPAPRSGAGFGLRGMSERVEAVGGELSYGPVPGRGWAVRATLPIQSGRQPTDAPRGRGAPPGRRSQKAIGTSTAGGAAGRHDDTHDDIRTDQSDKSDESGEGRV